MSEHGDVTTHSHGHGAATVDRRRFLGGLTAAAAAGAATAVASPAGASGGRRSDSRASGHGGPVLGPGPLPEPIPATVPTAEPGFDPPPPFDFIHWLLPRPEGATTQILGLPAFGLDVDWTTRPA